MRANWPIHCSWAVKLMDDCGSFSVVLVETVDDAIHRLLHVVNLTAICLSLYLGFEVVEALVHMVE